MGIGPYVEGALLPLYPLLSITRQFFKEIALLKFIKRENKCVQFTEK